MASLCRSAACPRPAAACPRPAAGSSRRRTLIRLTVCRAGGQSSSRGSPPEQEGQASGGSDVPEPAGDAGASGSGGTSQDGRSGPFHPLEFYDEVLRRAKGVESAVLEIADNLYSRVYLDAKTVEGKLDQKFVQSALAFFWSSLGLIGIRLTYGDLNAAFEAAAAAAAVLPSDFQAAWSLKGNALFVALITTAGSAWVASVLRLGIAASARDSYSLLQPRLRDLILPESGGVAEEGGGSLSAPQVIGVPHAYLGLRVGSQTGQLYVLVEWEGHAAAEQARGAGLSGGGFIARQLAWERCAELEAAGLPRHHELMQGLAGTTLGVLKEEL